MLLLQKINLGMKKLYFSICALCFLSFGVNAQTAFTAGNLVVYKIGNGTDTLSSAATPINLDEYTISGTFVQSHALPTTASGNNKRILASGTASSEGLMTRSADKQYLVVTGYDAAPLTTKISSATSAVANRMIGVISYDGSIDATTALTDAFSANNIRGAASTNGTDLWISGTGTNPGVRYAAKGSTTSTEISTTVTNIKSISVFNGQLYSTSASGSFNGVCTDGTGTPKTTGNTITLLNGFPSASGPDPCAINVSITGDTIYVADDRTIAAGGGIQKWVSNGGAWALSYTLTTGLTTGPRGLVVDWSGAHPVIYATTGEAPVKNLPGNSIVTTTDTGSTSSFTVLATAAANYVFRGIAFAPQVNSITPVTLLNFKAVLNNNAVQLLWSTSQEINTNEFEIYKSTDGINFSSIGTVPANGNSNSIHTYSLQDAHPVSGVNYYRVKTIDNNGAFTYSAIAQASYGSEKISIYPNPAQDQITVQYPSSNKALLIITDLQGKTIQAINIIPGSTSTLVNIEALSKGQYFVKYIDSNTTTVTALDKL